MIRFFALLTILMALTSFSVMAAEAKGKTCQFPGYSNEDCFSGKPGDQGKDFDHGKDGKDHDQDDDQDQGQDDDQDYDQDDGKPGHGHPGHGPGYGHPGHGHPGHGNPGYGHPGPGYNMPGYGHGYHNLCTGGFEGHYYGQPFPVAFFIQQNGIQLHVQSWFRGGYWIGNGICHQINPFQASFELYFPGAPIHRGLITRNQYGVTVMEGQLDFHYPFQLQRTR